MARKGLIMTMADVRAHAERHGFTTETSSDHIPSEKKVFVVALKDKPKMNKTEAAYACILEARKHRGEIVDWAFEPFSLRYGEKAFYKPDFVVILHGSVTIKQLKWMAECSVIEMLDDSGNIKNIIRGVGYVDVIEVKGPHIFKEAKPRFKAAKLRHEWATFRMMQRSKSGDWAQIL